jgi:hypothetical protein
LLIEVRKFAFSDVQTAKVVARSEPALSRGIVPRTASSLQVLDMPVAEQGA